MVYASRWAAPSDRERIAAWELDDLAAQSGLASLPPSLRDPLVGQQVQARWSSWEQRHPGLEVFALLADGEVAGRVVWAWSEGTLIVVDLLVGPAWRRRGLGRWAMERALAEASVRGASARLHVRQGHPVAALYRALGFVAVAEDEVLVSMRWDPPDGR